MALAMTTKKDLKEVIPLAENVIDHTARSGHDGESVAATQKVVSIFEPHTDIIMKNR